MPSQIRHGKPLVPFVKWENGEPYLMGSRCTACGQRFVGERRTCAKCTTRDQIESFRLARTGKVYVYTIVWRSFPGVATPFIDVVVDLDDGTHLKGTLLNVDPVPQKIIIDLPVRIVFRKVTVISKPEDDYVSYAFEPLNVNRVSIDE